MRPGKFVSVLPLSAVALAVLVPIAMSAEEPSPGSITVTDGDTFRIGQERIRALSRYNRPGL